MDAADATVANSLESRLSEIATVERDDESRRPLSGADLGLFVGVSIAVALAGVLVLAL